MKLVYLIILLIAISTVSAYTLIENVDQHNNTRIQFDYLGESFNILAFSQGHICSKRFNSTECCQYEEYVQRRIDGRIQSYDDSKVVYVDPRDEDIKKLRRRVIQLEDRVTLLEQFIWGNQTIQPEFTHQCSTDIAKTDTCDHLSVTGITCYLTTEISPRKVCTDGKWLEI